MALTTLLNDFVTRAGVIVQGTNSVTSSTAQTGTLQVNGGAAIAKNLIVGQGLTAWGNGDIKGTLTVGQQATLGSLQVTNASTFSSNLSVSGTLGVNGYSSFSGGLTATNFTATSLTVSGQSTLQNLSAAVTTVTNLTVTGQLSYNGTLTGITTASTINVIGNETVGGTLTVTGYTALNGGVSSTNITGTTLTITGQSTLQNVNAAITTVTDLTVNGNESITGTLGVTGQTTLQNLNAAVTTVTNLTVSGTSLYSGAATFNGTLTANGYSSFTAGVTANNVTATTVNVTGQSTLQNVNAAVTTVTTLTVTNNESVGGTLTVTGYTALNGGVATSNFTATTANVTGQSTLQNVNAAVTTVTTLTVTNNESVGGILTVTGYTALNGGVATSNFTATTANVTGQSTLQNVNAAVTTVTSLTVNGNEQVNGTLGATGVVTITNNTTASNPSIGALVVTGGVNVGNNLLVNSTAWNTGTNTDNALYVAGGAWIEKSLVVGTSALFQGPVTFSGTATYVFSTNTWYTDNILELHTPPTGVSGQWTLDDGKDVGFRFHYYTNSTDTNAALVLANDTKWLEWYESGAESSTGTFSNGNPVYGTFKTGSIQLANNTNATTTASGTLRVAGGIGLGLDLYAGGTVNANAATVRNLTTTSGLVYSVSGGTLQNAPVTWNSTLAQLEGRIAYANTATNLLGGAVGSMPYQASTGTTMLPIGTNGYILTVTGGLPSWTAVTGLSAGTSNTATNIAGGTAGQVPYQTAPGNTSFFGPGTAGDILVSNGASAPGYVGTASIYVGRAVNADAITVTNDVATTTTHYLTFVSASSGNQAIKTAATTGLTYNPSTGNIGIGAAAVSTARFYLSKNVTATTGTEYGSYLSYTNNLSGVLGNQIGSYANVSVANNSAKALSEVYASYSLVVITGDNTTATNVMGNRVFAGIGAGMTNPKVSNLIGTQIAVDSGSGSGIQVDNAYWLKISKGINTAGVVTNSYGVFIDDLSAPTGTYTNNYNFYSSGTNAKNVFMGSLGVGGVPAGAKLDITGGAKVSGITTVTNTTEATSTITGALQVIGGVGVGGNVWVGGDINIAGKIVFTGAGADTITATTGTFVNVNVTGTGLALVVSNNATVGGTFGVTGYTTLGALSAGITTATSLFVTGLSTLAAVTATTLTATTVTVSGNETVGGTLQVTGNTTLTGKLQVNDTTESNATNAGSIQTLGGMGLAKSIVAGGSVTAGTPSDGNVVTGFLSNNFVLSSFNKTTAAATLTDLDTYDATVYRTARYLIQVVRGTSVHVTEMTIFHDGTNVWMNEYGISTNAGSLADFDAIYTGTNVILRVTPNSATSTAFKVMRTGIKL